MISCKEYFELEKERIKEIAKTKHYRLDIIQIGDNPASNSYINGKLKDCDEVGIDCNHWKFKESIFQLELEDMMKSISEDSDGVIVQLPVPNHINAIDTLKSSIKPYQDVDGFIYDIHDPCTARGIIDWLEYNKIYLSGKHVVVIGRSNIVGKPLAKMMTDRDATVTLCHSKTPTNVLISLCSIADIIVVAVGKPKWFSFTLENRPLIIDVGINRDENGKLCGDVDRQYLENIGCYVTPVPGGVGLLTRLALLKNVIDN